MVTFERLENRFVWWVPPERVAAIRRLLFAARFFELDDNYACGASFYPNPSTTIRATIDGRTKTVVHYHGEPYHGCKRVPQLDVLEEALDVMVGTADAQLDAAAKAARAASSSAIAFSQRAVSSSSLSAAVW